MKNSIEQSDIEIIKELLEFWNYADINNIDRSFKVVARYKKSEKPDKNGKEYGFFIDVRDVKGRCLIYPNQYGKPGIYSLHNEAFIDNTDCLINVCLTSNIKRRNDNPYELMLADSILEKPRHKIIRRINTSDPIIDDRTPQDHIKERFNRLDNPDANKMIANLMTEIGKGMYSSKQRMIFEILQNADDAPGQDKVEFHIDVKDDYLFVMHDGAAFSIDDVDAITSAAESTKRADKKKTGYKGIGFKSVFTDSKEVWIKSGKYQFAFLRNSSKFENFDTLYLGQYIEYPDLWGKKQAQFLSAKRLFNPSTDVPWQVMPIWQDDMPEVFENTNFQRFNNNVQIALNIGKNNIQNEDGYISAIGNILKKPQFILFLRNTSKFRSPKNGSTVTRRDCNGITIINRTTVDKTNIAYHYYKEIFTNIDISDSVLNDFGLKRVKENSEIGEVCYFTTISGERVETIPSKLAEATETEISFAFIINEGKISNEDGYKENMHKYSSLFAFLPMEDTRFQLPFLVNADFIPSSDRQTIQGDNLWNKYIITKIAEKHIEAVVNFANRVILGNALYYSYLTLLLRELLPNDETAQILINSYNTTYCNKLNETPIIVNDINEKQILKDTILDMSNTSEIFGNDLFYKIIGTNNKRLPKVGVDIKSLEDYSYLKVEKLLLEDVSKCITPKITELIGDWAKDNISDNNCKIIEWINDLAKINQEQALSIPFIYHNDKIRSIQQLLELEDVFVVDDKTIKYKDILVNLGYVVLDFRFGDNTNIKNSIAKLDNYINNNQLMYERFASNKKLRSLIPIDKLRLLDFFQNNDFMKGIGEKKYLGELRIFADQAGIARPLLQLIDRDSCFSTTSLIGFCLCKDEYGIVPSDLRNKLIQPQDIFEKFILEEDLFAEWSNQFEESNISDYIDDIVNIYNQRNNDCKVSLKDWNSTPWIFINNEVRFTYSSNVFWSKSFNSIDCDVFSTLSDLISKCNTKAISHQFCGKLISEFKLPYDNDIIVHWDKIKAINTNDANLLLDWLEDDGSYNTFFDDFRFEKKEVDNWSITKKENEKKIYTSIDAQLVNYIKENSIQKFEELQPEFKGQKRNLLGIIQGDALILEILNSSLYNQAFANFLPKENQLINLSTFVSNIDKFELFISNEYDKISPEYKIIHNLMLLVDDESNIEPDIDGVIRKLKVKTTIDGRSLSEFNYSDKVFIKINDGRKIELSLSRILEEYKGESDILSALIERFAIKNKAKLRKLFFNTRLMGVDEIFKKIEAEKSDNYSVYQAIFESLALQSNKKLSLTKKRFDEPLEKEKIDYNSIQNQYIEFMNILLEMDYYPENIIFNKDIIDLKMCVDSSVSNDCESLPNWLLEWKKVSLKEREGLLCHFDYNGEASSIVKMRSSMIVTENYSEDSVIRFFDESKTQVELLYNTLIWLSNYSPEIITRNISVIEKICTFINLSNDVKSFIIPSINNISCDDIITYSLNVVDVKSKVYYLQERDRSHAYDIYEAMNRTGILINSKCGNLKKYITNCSTIKIEAVYDKDMITGNSERWNEQYYKKWRCYNECHIYIYNGNEMPCLMRYENYRIKQYTEGLICKLDDCIYISKKLSNSILDNLKDYIGQKYFEDLKEWHYKTLKDETLLDEDKFEYNEAIDRMLQDRFGISEENQREENNSSKREAIYFLKEQGYNVTQAVNNSYSIDNIFTPEGEKIRFIVRGAKGGLLYVDEDHWRMLDDESVKLIAIYPGNEARIFSNKKALLMDDLAENILFRVSNKRECGYIDDAFKSLSKNAHLILVTSEKMKENLFGRLKKNVKVVNENDSAIADVNFEID